jgi:hypothetical protein
VQLTEICGGWDESSEWPGFTLPRVLVLSKAMGKLRANCFPNLRHFRANVAIDGVREWDNDNNISPAYLQSTCKHCTGLRELDLTAHNSSFAWRDLDAAPPESSAEEVAAVQSLTSLRHLTRLSFTPSDD